MKELEEIIRSYVPFNEQEENDQQVMLTYLPQFSDVLTRLNTLFHFTTSAWVVNPKRTKVLMIYHNLYGSWSWVGGHADGNANLLEVIEKEIQEETGVVHKKLLSNGIFGLSIHSVKPHYKKGKYVNAHLHFDLQFLFEVQEEEPLKMKEDENSAVGWVEIGKLLDLVTEEEMKPFYQKLMKKVEENFPPVKKTIEK